MLLTILLNFLDRLAGIDDGATEDDEQRLTVRDYLMENPPEICDWDASALFAC